MKLWRKDWSWGSADIFPLQFFPHSPIPPSFFTLLSFICPSLILSACLRFFSSFFPLHHLLVLSVLCPSHRGFLWWPNYEIQQANWGCLKQGLLGRLAAAGKKQLGQGGPVLSFCLHTRTRKHRRASLSIAASTCVSDLKMPTGAWLTASSGTGHLGLKQGRHIFTVACAYVHAHSVEG